jgi:hypothetical protein
MLSKEAHFPASCQLFPLPVEVEDHSKICPLGADHFQQVRQGKHG